MILVDFLRGKIRDVSTHQLAELASKALRDVATLDDVLSTWHGVGKVINQQLVQMKGVRITALGTFTLTSGKAIAFIGKLKISTSQRNFE